MSSITELCQTLEKNAPRLEQMQCSVGFDGYLDQIIKAVQSRESEESFTPIPDISAFGTRILNAAGKSTNIELVTEQWKLGGNGPLMANSLGHLGLPVQYVGALGDPEIHEIYQKMHPQCSLTTVAQYGHTMAVEFEDGKIMFGTLAMTDLDWTRIQERVSQKDLARFFGQSALVAMVNWTQTPHMGEIWETLLNLYLDTVLFPDEQPYLFVDLADPEKRSATDIQQMLDQLKRFGKYYRVVIGLNEKESHEVARALNWEIPASEESALKNLALKIREAAGLFGCVIHPVKFAVYAGSQGTFSQWGPYEPSPKITTGAGDHFNAGFCLGLVAGLDPDQCLITGVANSGYYVRNGFSGSRKALQEFIQAWRGN